jgi:hypothetical protein
MPNSNSAAFPRFSWQMQVSIRKRKQLDLYALRQCIVRIAHATKLSARVSCATELSARASCAWRTLRLCARSLRLPVVILCGIVCILTTRPIQWIQPLFDIPMKARIRPIPHPYHIPVFHWVPVNILHMFDQILLVTNLIFPEPALPEP